MKNFLHATFKNKYLPFAYIASGVLAGVLGTYIVLMNVHPPENFTEVRLNTSQYHFTNPLLFYKSDADPRYDQLKRSLSSYINTAKRSGKAKDISVYFRDMNTGQWTGINEAQTYEPASMLKVTAMIAYYKRAVENPAILSRQIYYTPTSRAEETYRAQDR